MLTHRAKTILGDVPQDWQAKSVKTLLIDQFSGDWGADEGEQAVKVLRSTNFTDSGSLDFTDVATRYFETDKSNCFGLQKGDLLVERSGGGPTQPVGRIGFITEDFPDSIVSNFVHVFRPDTEKVDPEYFGWVLFELQRTGIVERVQQQSTQMRNLNFRDYLRLLLPYPELSEQRRIAAVLRLPDDAIDKAKVELEAIRELKRSLETSLLTGDFDQKNREKVQTKIGDIPSDWKVKHLKHLATIDSGITLNQDRKANKYSCRYLTVAHVQRGMVSDGDSRYLELAPDERKNKLLRDDDVLVVEGHANSLEIGRAAIYKDLGEPVTFQNHLFRVQVDPKRLLPKFLLYVLNSERIQRYWNAICNTSSGLNTINRRNLRNVFIQQPDLKEQHDIIDIMTASENKICTCEEKLIALQELKKSLLHNFLTGKTRVPEGVIHG